MAPPDRRTLMTLGLAVAAGSGVSAWLASLPPQGVAVSDTPVRRSVLDDPGSPRTGAERPDLTVAIFTDYHCGVCKRTDPALRELAGRDAGVGVIWKLWPIRGADAEAAARVAMAAHRQGVFQAVHFALMEAVGPLPAARAFDLAVGAGADAARLTDDLDRHDADIRRQLARHAAQAFGLGLEGTPAYLVGANLHQGGLDRGALKGAVRAARRTG